MGAVVSHGLLHCHLQHAGSVAAARSTINCVLILIPAVQGTVTLGHMRIAPATAGAPPAQCYAYAWTGYLEVLPVAATGLVQTHRQGAKCPYCVF